MNKIVIIHEYGAPNHFWGLTYLLKENGLRYVFYELNWRVKLRSGVKNFRPSEIFRAVRNWIFIQTLQYRKSTKVILGIAPYNEMLVHLRNKLRNHSVYYFTSYTVWDQSICVHDFHGDEKIIKVWRDFLLYDAKYIFAVSEKSKREMIVNNFATEDKVAVVNHSYITKIRPSEKQKKEPVFIAVGGLVKHKGVEELLQIFSKRPDLKIIFVGKGDLKEKVIEYSKKYKNIIYLGYINSQEELFKIYQQASFLILNSHKTPIWEELFGMVLVEASACGLIPVATDHSGPMEIIEDGKNGIICKEGDIEKGIDRCLAMDENSYFKMREASIENGQRYHMSNIAAKWSKILDD